MGASEYERRSRESAAAAISKGHADLKDLRALLIWTTATTTQPMISEYFSRYLNDEKLLSDLLKIALEGEDAGDAPWAAANVIAEFPAGLLAPHKAELQTLANQHWDYLNKPAQRALAKLGG